MRAVEWPPMGGERVEQKTKGMLLLMNCLFGGKVKERSGAKRFLKSQGYSPEKAERMKSNADRKRRPYRNAR